MVASDVAIQSTIGNDVAKVKNSFEPYRFIMVHKALSPNRKAIYLPHLTLRLWQHDPEAGFDHKMETLPMVAYHRRRWLLIPRRCRKSGPQGALHEPVAQGSQLSSARITTDWHKDHN